MGDLDDPAGCKLMNCPDLKDRRCHYPKDYCRYNPPGPCLEDMEDAVQEIERLRARVKELETHLAWLQDAAQDVIDRETIMHTSHPDLFDQDKGTVRRLAETLAIRCRPCS
jgi:hypothetical protein